MPYIDEDARLKFEDPWHCPENVGELTYAITSILGQYLDERLDKNQKISYADLAECLGALAGARFDFEDRIVKPYEKRKRQENNDVWGRNVLRYVKNG